MTSQDLRNITDARLTTINTLISAKDWGMAAYMMGYALECALKAVICKTLHLSDYPDCPQKNFSSEKIPTFFRAHEFETLLILSGMVDVLGYDGELYEDWSGFTQEFHGNWPTLRYTLDPGWDEIKTARVHNNLKNLINRIKKQWEI
ncbi:MAG TPA: hypothetical protein VMW82_02700 [Candidatus Paceibacterota bacterium]|nr:hypothetical protein [Candidatus Paceibacterota bacterium]